MWKSFCQNHRSNGIALSVARRLRQMVISLQVIVVHVCMYMCVCTCVYVHALINIEKSSAQYKNIIIKILYHKQVEHAYAVKLDSLFVM